jgi:multiple sugar transport system permease protein
LQNFYKQFFGNDRAHFLARSDPWGFSAIVFCCWPLRSFWLYRSLKVTSWIGMLGRVISAVMAIFIAWVMAASLVFRQHHWHAAYNALLCFAGCALQFVIGTGLAFLCSQPILGKNFFRDFLHPLMVTPLGVGTP